MSLQKLWFGTLKDGREFVALGSEPERALSTALQFRYKMKLRERQTVFEFGHVKFTEASFYVKDDEVGAGHVGEEPFGARPVDPLWWLLELRLDDVRCLLRQLNQGNIGGESVYMRKLYHRAHNLQKNTTARGRKVGDYYVFEIALMIRLSLVVDVARQAPWNKLSGGRALVDLGKIVESKAQERRGMFVEAHAGNIGQSLAEEMADFPGCDFGSVRDDEETQLRKLCKAYGYNLDEMEFSDALALFRGGPVEMRRLGTRHQLGFVDSVQYYRMNEWPKRAKFQKYLQTLRGPRKKTKLLL